MENKFGKIKTLEEAMECIKDGCTIMIGGFGGHGSPYDLCEAIIRKNVKDLTIISVDAGDPDLGLIISSEIVSAKNSSQVI